MTGRTLGHYRILEKLGEGGMGMVYKAEDTKLNRPVAVKFPPPDLSREEQLTRFQREAQAASALNHPHICTIYEVGEVNGRPHIVMEYVEGRTLKALLASGALPLESVLRYGAQIADALAHAHQRGIVHRDLKSANVIVTPEGRAKVLDFGLAQRLPEQHPEDATRSQASPAQAVAVVGTLQYMAPEVLRGVLGDERSDLWALGVLLYEMATGTMPFQGQTGFELSSAILERSAAPLPTPIPPGVRTVIQRCLAKEPAQRYQQAAEVRAALEAVLADSAPVPTVAARPVRWTVWAGGAIAVLALAAALAGGWLLLRRVRPLAPAPPVALTNFTDSVTSPALSPDGRMLAFIRGQSTFAGHGQIYVKMLPDGEPKQLTNDPLEKMSPVFSPDGSRIAYTTLDGNSWETWVVPVLGGTPQRLLPNSSGLTWIDPTHVMFSEVTKGLYMKVVTSTESRAEERDVYLPPNVEIGMAHRSYLSPDGKAVLVAEMDNHGWLACRVVPFPEGGAGRPVGPLPSKCTYAAWSPDGKWMYLSADAGNGFHLWRQRYPDGEAEQLPLGATEEEGIAVAPDGRSLVTSAGIEQSTVFFHDASGDRQISSQGYAYSPVLSADGSKVYYIVRSSASRAFVAGELWAADAASGASERLLPGLAVSRFDVSSDGKRVVFAVIDSAGKSSIWLAALDRRFPPRRLTTLESYRPYFGSRGTVIFVAKQGDRDYLFRINEDGSGQERLLAQPVIYLFAVSPDGQRLLAWVEVEDEQVPAALVAYSLAGGQAPRMICHNCALTGPGYSGASIAGWSPDQKFLYLRPQISGMSGRQTVVIPLPAGEALPKLPPDGVRSGSDLLKLPGARVIDRDVFPARDPSAYTFLRGTTQRNLYRIPLP